MTEPDRDIGNAVLAFRGDRTSAAAAEIFAEVDRRQARDTAEAERKTARAEWQERVELNRVLDGIVADMEGRIVEIDDDQRGNSGSIFKPGEVEKLSAVLDQREADEVLNQLATAHMRREREIDKFERLMETDIDEYHRQGGSDRLLELLGND